MSCYTVTFLVGAHRFGIPFPKPEIFSEIFLAPYIVYSQYEKMILGIFVYLFTKLQQQKLVFRNSAVKPQHALFKNEPFLHKMLQSWTKYMRQTLIFM